MVQQLPKVSREEFLIRLPKLDAPAQVRREIAKHGTVVDCEGLSGQLLFRLRDPPGRGPRESWEFVRGILAGIHPDTVVNPVLLGDDNKPRYSVGSVTVRFRSVPTDKELESFASLHGLHLKARNDYVPSQVSFEPAHQEGFLLDILRDVGESEEIVAAWPETVSAYQRE